MNVLKPRKQHSNSPSRSGTDATLGSPVPSLNPARKWLFRLLALVVIPLLLLGAFEGALRIAGYGYDTGLFKKLQIGSDEFLVNNDSFGLRFFPPQLERFTGPIRIAAHKPASTYRIFILGESAAMGDPEPAYAASRYLEALLNERFPATHFEIVNVGITAINSHVILPIARDCARNEGDLWIVYMGNNEMVGPFGAATIFGEKAPPLGFVRLNLALQKFRLGQLVVNLGRALKSKRGEAPSWGGMEMFVGNRIAPDDPRREVVYKNFQKNLEDIVQTGLDSGAKVLLNTVAVNLKDCPPFASLTNSNLPAMKREQFDQRFHAGRLAQENGNFPEAEKQFEQAAQLDANYSELQFHWAESLAHSTNFSAARDHFQRACDLDALPFRADSRINRLITQAATRYSNDGLTLVDAAAALAADNAAGLCGQETFYEHVHLNFDGNYRLARLWAEQVQRALPPSIASRAAINVWATQVDCEQRLGLTDWNRALIFQHVIGRYNQPPLSGQANNPQRIADLRERLNQLHARMDATSSAKARTNFVEAIGRYPDDFCLRENYAIFLQTIGDLPQAVAEWRHIRELLPQDYLACFQLGRLLGIQGQSTEAEALLQSAVARHPSLTEGWLELGNVLAAQNKFETALANYQRARQQRPQDPQIAFRIGKALAKSDRHPEAMSSYREAIQLNPDFWEAHYELAGEFDAAGKLDQAKEEFAQSVRLQPGNSRAHFNLGVLLAKQGQIDEARLQFEETLRLEPGYQKAREYLAQVNLLIKQRK